MYSTLSFPSYYLPSFSVSGREAFIHHCLSSDPVFVETKTSANINTKPKLKFKCFDFVSPNPFRHFMLLSRYGKDKRIRRRSRAKDADEMTFVFELNGQVDDIN